MRIPSVLSQWATTYHICSLKTIAYGQITRSGVAKAGLLWSVS